MSNPRNVGSQCLHHSRRTRPKESCWPTVDVGGRPLRRAVGGAVVTRRWRWAWGQYAVSAAFKDSDCTRQHLSSRIPALLCHKNIFTGSKIPHRSGYGPQSVNYMSFADSCAHEEMSCSVNDIVKKTKRQATAQEKTFANLPSDKGLVSRTCKEPSKLKTIPFF